MASGVATLSKPGVAATYETRVNHLSEFRRPAPLNPDKNRNMQSNQSPYKLS